MVVLSESDENVPKYVPFVNVRCTAVSQEMRGDAVNPGQVLGKQRTADWEGGQTDMRSRQALLRGMQAKLELTNCRRWPIYFYFGLHVRRTPQFSILQMSGI